MSNLTMFAKRLKEAREEKGFTQRDLAEKTSVTPASLSSYEKGNSVPSLSVVKELSEACDVSIDWLCGLRQDDAKDTKVKTYGDLIASLAQVLGNTDLTIHMGAVLREVHGAVAACRVNIELMLGPEDPACTCELGFFFKDWQPMRDLVKSGSLKQEVLDSWIKEKIEEFSKYEIEKCVEE